MYVKDPSVASVVLFRGSRCFWGESLGLFMEPKKGIFDGNGHRISKLYMNTSTLEKVGLCLGLGKNLGTSVGYFWSS